MDPALVTLLARDVAAAMLHLHRCDVGLLCVSREMWGGGLPAAGFKGCHAPTYHRRLSDVAASDVAAAVLYLHMCVLVRHRFCHLLCRGRSRRLR
jgi:hypothetical protein